jgi:hypothetical protein
MGKLACHPEVGQRKRYCFFAAWMGYPPLKQKQGLEAQAICLLRFDCIRITTP